MKPVTRFEVGMYYRYVGPGFRNTLADHEAMRAILDGRPRQCISVGPGETEAEFEGIEGGSWHWYAHGIFEEVTSCVSNENAEPYPGYLTRDKNC